jgi:hypothetical protein
MARFLYHPMTQLPHHPKVPDAARALVRVHRRSGSCVGRRVSTGSCRTMRLARHGTFTHRERVARPISLHPRVPGAPLVEDFVAAGLATEWIDDPQ